jgi:hypothetical protein
MNKQAKWEYRQLGLCASEFPEVSSARPVREVKGNVYVRMQTLGDQGSELAPAV